MAEIAANADHGWAGLAAGEWALLVPLTSDVRDAGGGLIDNARERARVTGADTGDILAGNAFLALEANAADARGMAAACLGAIAVERGAATFVVRVVRSGDALDCTIEPLAAGDDGLHAVRARLAALTGLAPESLVPGRAVETR